MERVASEVANFIATQKKCEVKIITLRKAPVFYNLDDSVEVIKPEFCHKNKVSSTFFTLKYLRDTLTNYNPDAVLSFGSKFNAFTILSCLGLNLNIFVSDRSNPYRNSTYNRSQEIGRKQDHIIHLVLKRLLYPFSKGIIAQTELAKEIDTRFLKHKNIKVIGNPISPFTLKIRERENIVLNVGRFIESKNQLFLLKAFHKIGNPKWKLYFAGDGPTRKEVEKAAVRLGIENQVFFLGKVNDIDALYAKSKIFAFTSFSEGFPNALAEAMRTPVSSISFDCIAGPSDLIQDGENGILIKKNDECSYIEALKDLMDDEELRLKLEKNSKEFMKKFSSEKISMEYYNFLIKNE